MNQELFHSVWPLFFSEARDQLDRLTEDIGNLEDATPEQLPPLLVEIRRTAHSLKGAASSLGLGDIEQIVHTIEGALKGTDVRLERRTINALLAGLDAVDETLKRCDKGGSDQVPNVGELLKMMGHHQGAPVPSESEPDFLARLTSDIAALEGLISSFFSPDELARTTALEGGLQLLEALRSAAAAVDAKEIFELSGSMAELLRNGASDPAQITTAAADAVMGLDAARARLQQSTVQNAEAPAPAVEAEENTPEPSRPEPSARGDSEIAPGSEATSETRKAGDKVLKVPARTIDALTRQLEQLLLLQGSETRRTREIATLAEAVAEALSTCEHAVRTPEAQLRATVVGLMSRLREVKRGGVRVAREAKQGAERLQLVGRVIREDLRDLLMMPASLMLEPLRRAVRDVSRRLEKPVELAIEGGDVRLDRRIIEELRDPLLHLVRNAVDHGLESPERRKASGKPSVGKLRVRVEPHGARIVVLVEDDGGGIDVSRVKAVALERGIIDEQAVAKLSDAEAARLIFAPGFSTRTEVTAISGRGVGLDVVANAAHNLQGTVEIRSTPGKGTVFVLDLPLTLAARLGLLVSVAGEICALPIDGVHSVLRLKRDQLGSIAGRVVAKVRGQMVPFVQLGSVIGLGRSRPAEDDVQRALLLEGGTTLKVLVGIDAILGEQELIVQPLGRHLAKVAHLAGAAVLASGSVVPVLNVVEVIRQAQPVSASDETGRRIRVLVVDDSLTTRSALKVLLEIAGYEVMLASNGADAFRVLQETACELVVTDVEMPILDGFGLTRKIKADPKLAGTPVILITSLDSAQDRAQGLKAGADGHVVKREAEGGKLLELVRQLLPEAPRAQ